MTKEEKRRCFEEMGVDVLIEFPLDAQTAAIPPEDFVREILCGKMHTRYLAAGTDLPLETAEKETGICSSPCRKNWVIR